MKISEKGKELQKRFKIMRYASLLLLLAAAGSFVFFHSIPGLIFFFAINIIMEVKFYCCPHCAKGLDCRRGMKDETRCPKCERLLFKEYKEDLQK